jgi:heme A synthase
MPLNLIHSRLANSVILYFFVLMIWALWRFFRKQEMNPNYRGALVIGAFLVLAQALLGVLLWIRGIRPGRAEMHILYGVVSVLGIPAAYLYARERQNRYQMLIIAAGLLFLIGITFRSMATG